LCEEVNEKTNIIKPHLPKFKMKKEKNRRVFPFCAIRAGVVQNHIRLLSFLETENTSIFKQ